uniref:GST N-terminal domain-containing protein n=1 Tax=Kalmanozyma brasiliensis (strain GHG001) TaxID=1365824 RepID=V5EN92_KALBG
MTTPEIHHAPSERGTIELIGPSHCTFTRSIALALHELGIPYIAIHRAPHSADVRSLNPYGLTPVLRHRQEGLYASPETTVVLSASHAVRRYIDEHLAPLCSRSTLTPPLRVGDAKSVVERSKCDAWIESISHTLFPAIEAGYVGSALQMRKNGADGETINVALELELNRVQALLEIVESQAKAAEPARQEGS